MMISDNSAAKMDRLILICGHLKEKLQRFFFSERNPARNRMQKRPPFSDVWKYMKLLQNATVLSYLISTVCLSRILSQCESKGNIYFTAFHSVKSPRGTFVMLGCTAVSTHTVRNEFI